MSHTHIISIIRVCFVDYGCTYNSSLCCLCIANVLLMCCLCVANVLLHVRVCFVHCECEFLCIIGVLGVCFVRYRCVFCTLPVCVLYVTGVCFVRCFALRVCIVLLYVSTR
jgi:hypothetical protein